MANQVRVETFIYRINPDNDKELQRRSIGGSSWSRVTEFNGNHILDLLLAPNGRDIEVYTDFGIYIREYSGGVRRK
jgi:hypothetical protein